MLNQFLYGAACMSSLVIALFFIRFWQKSRDRLFALFGAAFIVLVLERILIAAIHAQDEFHPFVYVVRLIAFLMIIAAIIDKNRRG